MGNDDSNDNERDGPDGPEAGGAGLFPIRVVSQRTGVNTVTLRAWERRYGLMKPVRTPKGHRLYSEEDISRVARIVAWIDRGVSIGRVRALLEHDSEPGTTAPLAEGDSPATDDSDWARYGARIAQALATFDEHRLDDTVNEALSLYPFATVCERLLAPLAGDRDRRRGSVATDAPGDAAARAFGTGYLRRKLASRLQFDARPASGAPVLVAALPGAVNDLALLTIAVGCVGMDVPVLLLESALAAEEIIVAGERRRPAAIVLHGEEAQDAAGFARFLQKLVDARIAPVAVGGPAARIHEGAIVAAGARALIDAAPALVVRRLELPVRSGGGERDTP